MTRLVVSRAPSRLGGSLPSIRKQVVAFVTGANLSVAMINEHCTHRLAKFKRPSVVEVVRELPRGVTGKVRKGVLRGMFQA